MRSRFPALLVLLAPLAPLPAQAPSDRLALDRFDDSLATRHRHHLPPRQPARPDAAASAGPLRRAACGHSPRCGSPSWAPTPMPATRCGELRRLTDREPGWPVRLARAGRGRDAARGVGASRLAGARQPGRHRHARARHRARAPRGGRRPRLPPLGAHAGSAGARAARHRALRRRTRRPPPGRRGARRAAGRPAAGARAAGAGHRRERLRGRGVRARRRRHRGGGAGQARQTRARAHAAGAGIARGRGALLRRRGGRRLGARGRVSGGPRADRRGQ